NGIDLVCVPAFAKIEIDGEERTAIKFQLESR
ncbi:MAG: stage V sporulation protein S, partial [Synergistales bacterium]|nr:stage V sporulation protein S [Synergistales bacterium]